MTVHKMSKRKRVVLSLKDKINIIDSLKKGEAGRNLANKYGVGTSTISDIKKNTNSILKYTYKLDKEDGSKQRKAMKKPKNELMEEALYCWFLQQRSTGQPTSGPTLCEKALELNKKIGGDDSFVASNGWLYRFKSRHGIREFDIRGEKISPDDAANSFTRGFKKELHENDYDLDFVYNAAETGLNWKSLPSKCLASRREDFSARYKTTKERVTILICANATGTHKIPLLLIGKPENPRCFQNIRIPLIYNSQKSVCMNTEIFNNWYDNVFIIEVKKYQNEIGKRGNVLLLLDNARIYYPSTELLEREDGLFKVTFLPPNVKCLLQPMNHVNETFKLVYRKQFLRKLFCVDEDNTEGVLDFFKQMTLKDCCYRVADAWDLIGSKTLYEAWNRILERENRSEITNTDNSILEDIYERMRNILICRECDAEDIKEWLACDGHDQGSKMMSDDEIIENILQTNEQEIKEEIEVNIDAENDAGPSHAEAFQVLDTAFKWFEKQEE